MRLLKFYAPWCNPCKQQSVILEKLEDVVIESINVDEDENEDIVEKYKVRGLPTLILLNDEDELISRFSGLTQREDIEKALKDYESTSNK